MYEELSEHGEGSELSALQLEAFSIPRSDITEMQQIGAGEIVDILVGVLFCLPMVPVSLP